MGLLQTGTGFWNPLVWSVSLFIIVLLVYFIRFFGEKKYKPGTEQTMPFCSGSRPPELPIRANSIYWGFFKAMDKHYKALNRIHTGLLNDYVFWFIIVIVIMLTVLSIGGL